jgi:hypothetical protein
MLEPYMGMDHVQVHAPFAIRTGALAKALL